MEVHQDMGEGRYLGLPSLIGSAWKKVFSLVKERAWKRIQGWRNCKISRIGKTIMIKNVTQAILSYCIYCFLLPKTLSTEIEKMFNGYWW